MLEDRRLEDVKNEEKWKQRTRRLQIFQFYQQNLKEKLALKERCLIN